MSQEPDLQQILLQSMLADVVAFKPGNVSYDSPRHDMDADMFVKSAHATAPIMVSWDHTVAGRILEAVKATRQAVACNTNLGIIMLCVPLVEAMRRLGPRRNIAALRLELAAVLAGLDRAEGATIYQAIRTASPGGLGRSDKYDVTDSDGGQIHAAMRHARNRDRIAMQYCSAYHDVFTVGWPCMSSFHAHWGDLAWALAACYIRFLCGFADSHVLRSHGENPAQTVRGMACTLWQQLSPIGPPAGRGLRLWRDLDSYCKRSGLNPGTSADLSVASMLVELWVQGCPGQVTDWVTTK